VCGGGEAGHVEADLGRDHLRGLGSDAGDLVEAGQRGQHRRIRAEACIRAGGAVGVDALSIGQGSDQRLDPLRSHAEASASHGLDCGFRSARFD
jgi:hypothetical protein